MFTLEEKAEIVDHFILCQSITSTRRYWETATGRTVPSAPSICRWHRNFQRTGSAANRHGGGKPQTRN